MDQKRTFRIVRAISAIPPKADIDRCPCHVRFVPCVDGSELARRIFTLQAWSVQPCVRQPSADQVPIKSAHSTMLWPKWVVLIAGSTGSALRAVRSPQPSHHATILGAISFFSAARIIVPLARSHHEADTATARTTVLIEKINTAEFLQMDSDPARIFAFFPHFGKPSSGREQHVTCLDSSDQF
jgi:hypothetical protein